MEGSHQPPLPPSGQQPPSAPQQPPAAPQAPSAPEPPTASPAEQQRHTFNAQQNVQSRPCAACGGQLEFNIGQQQLVCPHCGSAEAIVHAPGAAVVEQSFASIAVAPSANHFAGGQGEKEIVCQNCGGHTTFIGTLTATKCPYCATPIQRTDVHEAPDRLAVNGVLPFTVTDDAAKDLLDKWVHKRWFAPNEFKKYSSAGSFESVYAAYFTYDADATTDYRGERGDTHTRTVGHGEDQRTETVTHWSHAAGRVFNSFDDITVLGNTGFDPKYVNKLEPWPTQQLQPYHSDYIAGHLCRTYDRDVETSYQEARSRMEATIDGSVRRDIGGDQQRIHQKSTQISNLTYKHILLPIWLLTVIYQGQPLQVFLNGVTGEIHGERPWSKVKIISLVIAVIALLVLIAVARAVLS